MLTETQQAAHDAAHAAIDGIARTVVAMVVEAMPEEMEIADLCEQIATSAILFTLDGAESAAPEYLRRVHRAALTLPCEDTTADDLARHTANLDALYAELTARWPVPEVAG